MIRTLGTFAISLSLVAACTAADDEPAPTTDGFVLVQHTSTTLEAFVVDSGERLDVVITESAPGVVDVTFDFGDPVIAFAIDYNRGVGGFMPSGAALDAAHSRLVDAWLAGVSEVIEMDAAAQSRVEFAAVRQASFMQIVPTGETLVAFDYQSKHGWTHISCSCGNQNIGGYTRLCGKGCGCGNAPANGCAGRCGQGCGGTSTPKCVGTTVYTRDCAKHDYGLGSWGAASDDYSFASNNCSCGGNCY